MSLVSYSSIVSHVDIYDRYTYEDEKRGKPWKNGALIWKAWFYFFESTSFLGNFDSSRIKFEDICRTPGTCCNFFRVKFE